MQYLGDIEKTFIIEKIPQDVALCVIVCDCGYHIGMDATFLEQVEDFYTLCPACKLVIDTAITKEVTPNIT